ncbi:hypothetical protein [Methanogenium cariaci]|uniref:hypothetical protein n=1 Tax=Methanogenium cariaci TaxID=2197 RepID=UPI00078619D2|nr:hypothetical protein [Methanogenium cariaci]
MSHTDTNIIPSELGLRIKEKITLLHSMPPLPTDVIRKRDEELKVLHTYYSNAIDGNSLDLSETESVVTEGMTIEATSLPEHREAVNTATAFERMETLAREGGHQSAMRPFRVFMRLLSEQILMVPGNTGGPMSGVLERPTPSGRR